MPVNCSIQPPRQCPKVKTVRTMCVKQWTDKLREFLGPYNTAECLNMLIYTYTFILHAVLKVKTLIYIQLSK